MAPLIISLSGCVPDNRSKITAPVSSEEKKEDIQQEESFKLYQAKWNDIPFPIGAVPEKEYTRESNDQLGCTFALSCALPASQCLDFYKQEMERLGWRQDLVLTFEPPEYVLFYQKPTRLATITLQILPEATQVRIYTGFKQV